MEEDDLSDLIDVEMDKVYRDFVVYVNALSKQPLSLSESGFNNIFEEIIDFSRIIREKYRGEEYNSKLLKKHKNKLYTVMETIIIVGNCKSPLSDISFSSMMDMINEEIDEMAKII